MKRFFSWWNRASKTERWKHACNYCDAGWFLASFPFRLLRRRIGAGSDWSIHTATDATALCKWKFSSRSPPALAACAQLYSGHSSGRLISIIQTADFYICIDCTTIERRQDRLWTIRAICTMNNLSSCVHNCTVSRRKCRPLAAKCQIMPPANLR